MTKAERIFNATYYSCMNHIKNWGEERNPNGKMVGFNALSMEDNERGCTRTFNAVQKEINRQAKMLDMFAKHGVGTEKAAIRKAALEMTQSTLDNAREHYDEFMAMLKA